MFLFLCIHSTNHLCEKQLVAIAYTFYDDVDKDEASVWESVEGA